MTVEDYLKSQKENCSKVDLSPADQEFLDKNGLEAFIRRCLLSKKFRKWRVSQDYLDELKESVKYAVQNQQPINATFFFGAYKLWRFKSYPEADWAEFFNLSYIISYLAPIVKVYTPGALMTYWAAHESIMRRQSNIPEESCRQYRESFIKLIAEFQPYLPGNLRLELRDVTELYPNEAEYKKELEAHIQSVEQEYPDWSDDRKRKKAASSIMNIQWRGADDWEGLNESDKQEKIRQGPIVHDGYCHLTKLLSAIRGLGKIDLTATPLPNYNSIPIGSTSASAAKFWTGFGVLERQGENYIERVLSPKQYEKAAYLPQEKFKINLIPLINFKEIWLFLNNSICL